jgi:hypothetical protein
MIDLFRKNKTLQFDKMKSLLLLLEKNGIMAILKFKIYQ